jgi:hypothetical protein
MHRIFQRVISMVAMLVLACMAQATDRRAQSTDCSTSVCAQGSVSTERVFDLQLRNGNHQRVLYATAANAKAIIVMLPGGAGDIGIGQSGDLRHDENFVVRSRALWIERGYDVLIPDTLNSENLRGLRSSPAYAALVGELVHFAHTKSSAAVFLLGTSQGSIAAMNGAAHLSRTQLAGVVLTESVSRQGGSHETVFQANPQDVRVPALVVANHDDRCDVAPPEDAPQIVAAMSNSPQVKLLYVRGGISRSSKLCGSLTPHGYYGIESNVVGQIADWMDRHLR